MTQLIWNELHNTNIPQAAYDRMKAAFGDFCQLGHVADLGCGRGELSAILDCLSYDGYDMFPKNKKTKQINMENGEGLHFKYDTIIMNHVLEHFRDPASILATYKNYCDRMIIVVPDCAEKRNKH